MALVNLRDTIDKHGLQFQIKLHGQNKTFTFQATTKEVREMWTSEIRRLLQAQFSLMKGERRTRFLAHGHYYDGCFSLSLSLSLSLPDMVLQSGILDRSNYKGKARTGET